MNFIINKYVILIPSRRFTNELRRKKVVVQKMKIKVCSYTFIIRLHGKLNSEAKVKLCHTLGTAKHAVRFAFELK